MSSKPGKYVYLVHVDYYYEGSNLIGPACFNVDDAVAVAEDYMTDPKQGGGLEWEEIGTNSWDAGDRVGVTVLKIPTKGLQDVIDSKG
jgi:hypothetical protein